MRSLWEIERDSPILLRRVTLEKLVDSSQEQIPSVEERLTVGWNSLHYTALHDINCTYSYIRIYVAKRGK